jgi:hypothetical protein
MRNEEAISQSTSKRTYFLNIVDYSLLCLVCHQPWKWETGIEVGAWIDTPLTPLKRGIRIVMSLYINKKKKINGLEKLMI